MLALSVAALQTTRLGYPEQPEVTRGDLAIIVEDYATLPVPGGLHGPLSRVSVVRHEPGSLPEFSTRVFVGDLDGRLYILDVGTKAFLTYIDFDRVFAKFVNGSSYGSGFATFAFDPAYEQNGRFYTVHTEGPNLPGSEAPSNVNLPGLDLSGGYATTASIDPPVGTVARQAVLIEWIDTDVGNAVFEGTAREVLRIGFNHGNHSIADMLFNPTALPGSDDYGNLYIAAGDGGAGQADDDTHSMPQRLDTLPGKILRITPDLNLRPADGLASNGRYRVPTTGADPNPFVALADESVKDEIFAYGFRNPQRMSWDTASDVLIVADIGLYAWEELNIVHKGANYGYAEREGPEQLFVGGLNDGLTGGQTMPPTDFPNPDTLVVAGIGGPVAPVYPVAAYSHHDGDAISGGFVYRGTRIPQLDGKYIFGDITTARIFSVDLSDMLAADDGDPTTLAPIRELNLVFDTPDDSPDGGAVATRLFDVIAHQYLRRGGTTNGGVLPGAASHMSDAQDPDGIPYGGGRADIRFAIDREGELYILSKSDGMIRAVVGARTGGTTTVLTSSPSPSTFGQDVQVNALVTGHSDVPTGVVEFLDGSVTLGTTAISAGVATIAISSLEPGDHLLVARFVPSGVEWLGSAAGRPHYVAEPSSYAVTVSLTGSGGGVVTSTPEGIACPTTCTASFDEGALVTLTATPGTASRFVGWGGACAGTSTCSLTVDAAKHITAGFAPGQADLITSLSSIPATGVPGVSLAIVETTTNQGSGSAALSKTRYYLSIDQTRSAGDILLSGQHAIPALAPNASAGGSVKGIKAPLSTTHGVYFLIACADDTAKIPESSESNNCAASSTQIRIGRPDLVALSVGNLPATLAAGATFSVTVTTQNQGTISSVSSTTRFYLSLNTVKDASDVLFAKTLAVGGLAPAQTVASARTLTMPTTTPGTYRVLACADDKAKIAELDETNNCAASGNVTIVP